MLFLVYIKVHNYRLHKSLWTQTVWCTLSIVLILKWDYITNSEIISYDIYISFFGNFICFWNCTWCIYKWYHLIVIWLFCGNLYQPQARRAFYFLLAREIWYVPYEDNCSNMVSQSFAAFYIVTYGTPISSDGQWW